MLIYEVNIRVAQDVATRYYTWLQQHCHYMLQHPGFLRATIHSIASTTAQSQFCVHYLVESQTALDHYLTHHATQMRAQALDLFGTQFSAQRRVLCIKDTIHPLSVRAEDA